MEVLVTDAAVLRKLVTRFSGDGAVRKPAELYSGRRKRSLAFPTLAWKPNPSKKAADNAMKTASKLLQKVGCPTCDQSGYIVRNGKKMIGKRYVTVPSSVPCHRCRTSRLVYPLDIWKAARSLAATLTGVSPTDPRIPQVERRLEEGISAAANLADPLFVKRLNDSAIEAVDPAGLVPGQSILLPVPAEYWSQGKAKGWEEYVRFVLTPRCRVILIHPTSRNVITEGHDALIAATIAGYVTIDDDDWTVLERAIVVTIRLDREETGR